ncbi:ATPase/GTPase, AAA15 family [Butyrivibrio fibrisolvens DSM 3071]|uniref:ATPase/GTPase, AAA15 family n=1 Tax=Butyrivibrio fibrisolvens DSM 3071 TaxID=1121131 RepID=A0A1M5XTG5_BUTFI|nr:AAA family ATPase [Butyrivibrio fibrisolvens]SHI02808.1 ATPase/GTPase, AAA15 family [Butyrivibrio fibrisolvens DSM 3071]
MNNIVRIAALTIKNFKNVGNGKIVMPSCLKKEFVNDSSEVLGIYGQNGSGKTAVVDAMFFLQKILVGSTLDEDIAEYLTTGSQSAEIEVDFNIFIEKVVFEVTYKVVLKREDKSIVIDKESLSCAKNENGDRTNKTVFIEFDRNDSSQLFKPAIRVQELVEENKENKTDLIVAKKMAEKSRCSYIFGESSREVFCRQYSNGFRDYSDIIKTLYHFAVKDLFVIRNAHSGVITAQIILPMAFRIEENEGGSKGDLPVLLREPITLPFEEKELLHRIVDQINIVLNKIIPGLQIVVKEHGKQALDSGEDGWKVELMSKRDDQPEIPIRMESEGIVKIISILSALIQAYNQPSVCLVIDELDAGIFEYMLGELLDIFNTDGKGQLIFTSHNLRALEMLDKENIVFSTVNPDNRYIRMKNVRESNNLRKQYIKALTLGGQDEVIYDETNSLKIARAFRKAGKSIGES